MQRERHNLLVLDHFCPQFLMWLKSKRFLAKSKRTQFADPGSPLGVKSIPLYPERWHHGPLPHHPATWFRYSPAYVSPHQCPKYGDLFAVYKSSQMNCVESFLPAFSWLPYQEFFCNQFTNKVASDLFLPLCWFYLHQNIILWSFIQIKREWIRANYSNVHLTTLPFNIS